MPNQINLLPEVLDLILYAGDGISFKLICTNAANAPVDITGGVEAHVRLNRIDETDPIVEFTASMVDAYLGIVVLSLTGAQTRELTEHPSADENGKFVGVWDIQWTPSGSQPRTLCQGKVECVADVTR